MFASIRNIILLAFSIHIVLCSVCDIEINTDRLGNDYDKKSIQSSASCCALCNNAIRCQAWTNVAQGDPREGCYLKEVTPPKGDYIGPFYPPCGSYCSSGRKPIPSTCTSNFEISADRPGYDFVSTPYSDGPEACCSACEARIECKSWTYVNNWTSIINGCYLKSQLAPVIPSSPCGNRCISGMKNYKMTHSEANNALNAAGISVHSTGSCSVRSNPMCISFDQINSKTINGVITLRRLCNCPITVTGGTEEGHASGTTSHYNGYKVDVRLDDKINSYITSNFQKIADRGDGAQQYKSSSGDIYAKEGSHWDILYI